MSQHRTKLHPVVDAYLHTDKILGQILTEAPEPKDAVTRAMIALREALFTTRSAEEARTLAETADLSGADADLLAMFFGVWGRLATAYGRYSEAASLFKRAWTLVGRRTPPEIRAMLLITESQLLLSTGRKEQAEAQNKEALAIVARRSPRYPMVFGDHAIHLAKTGQGAELQPEMDRLCEAGRIGAAPWYEIFSLHQFANTGQIERIAACSAAVRAGSASVRLAGTCSWYEILASVLQGRSEAELPDWAAVIRELLAGRPAQALQHARQAAGQDSGFLYGWSFDSFNMIRAELANGQHEAARRLIRLRRQMGNTHYLDGFFLARVELLAGNRERAAGHFAAVYAACEHYQAEKRLEIELAMACELSRSDVMFLTAAAHRPADRAASRTAARPPAESPERAGSARLVGESPAMATLRKQLAQMATLDAPVLLTGETGTGKELAARALHESGPRAAEPFIAFNCGAIAESLLESELFGHEKGAFTGADRAHRGLFEEAGAGTVLLDEIGEISPRLQASLLRVLESGEIRPVGSARSSKIRCRLVAATNSDLAALTERGAFRKDLLYRLKRLEIHIPPLRERREDILPLAELFLAEGRSEGLRPRLSPELRAELLRRDWPGNVRELKNDMERMRLLNSDRLEYGLAELTGAKPTAAQEMGPPAVGGPPTHRGCTRSGRLGLVRELFQSRRRLTRSEVIRSLGISQATATAYLKALCEEGLIEKVEPTAAPRTHYFRLRSSLP